MHLNKGLVKLEKESYIPKEKGKEKEIGVLLATAAWSTTGSVPKKICILLVTSNLRTHA